MVGCAAGGGCRLPVRAGGAAGARAGLGRGTDAAKGDAPHHAVRALANGPLGNPPSRRRARSSSAVVACVCTTRRCHRRQARRPCSLTESVARRLRAARLRSCTAARARSERVALWPRQRAGPTRQRAPSEAMSDSDESFHDAEADVGDGEPWHAGACAAADEAFALLLACERPGQNWKHAGYEQGVAVEKMAYGHAAWADLCPWVDTGYSLFRASERFEHETPQEIFRVLHDWPARCGTPGSPGWDAGLEALRIMTSVPPPAGTPPGRTFAVAQHLSKPTLSGLVGRREFIFIFATRREAEGTADEAFMSVCRSEPGSTAALAPTAPPGYTRGDLFLGAVMLRRDPEGGARLTLLTCAAPRGSIPRAAVNLGGVKGAALLADLRRHLDARRAKK